MIAPVERNVAPQTPQLLGGRTADRPNVARIEAVAASAEIPGDTMAGGAGLGAAIEASAPVAPPAIRTEVAAVLARPRPPTYGSNGYDD